MPTFLSFRSKTDNRLVFRVMRLFYVLYFLSPHVDFGTIINETTQEIMEFDRVGFARNPSNTANDECYIEAKCRQPLFELSKLGNSRLQDTFPEMITFLKSFAMSTNDANQILLYQRELELVATPNSNMSSNSLSNDQITQIWANASCIWLKENLNEVKSSWLSEITRYDCIGGCGFNYYYDSISDFYADNPINISYTIGGECDIDNGECLCDSPYLVHDCRLSCPGLIGPISDGNNNFTFQFCSGHGVCHIGTQVCKCDTGFGNSDCGYSYDVFTYNQVLKWVFVGFFGGIIILYGASLFWLKSNVKYAVKMCVFVLCLVL